MTEQKSVVDQQMNRQMNASYTFRLKENTEFQGEFKQLLIRIYPTSLNGTPINLAVADISKIQKVNDPGWKVSRKFKYFIFELFDGSKIAGLPDCKDFLVSMPSLGNCRVEFKNILIVEKVRQR